MLGFRPSWSRWIARELLAFIGLTLLLAWTFLGIASGGDGSDPISVVCRIVGWAILVTGLLVLLTWLRARLMRRQAP
jgi:DMSO/TMAO reductase YedYZ heme-binding membrane subunit